MERVVFLIEETGERIDCLLNPETVVATRLAGVRHRSTARGQVIGSGLADDPLQFTGGGRTELTLDLLFDVDFVEESVRPADVRALTRPLWMLAENSAEQRGAVRNPQVLLAWGKTWRVPGVVVAVAERFDAFDSDGTPRRSWLRIKLVRVADSTATAAATFEEELVGAQQVGAGTRTTPGEAVQAIADGRAEPGFSGVRFDLLATDGLGSPFLWRLLAQHNNIANPLDVPPGTVLDLPPATSPSPGPSS
jgi:phage protein U